MPFCLEKRQDDKKTRKKDRGETTPLDTRVEKQREKDRLWPGLERMVSVRAETVKSTRGVSVREGIGRWFGGDVDGWRWTMWDGDAKGGKEKGKRRLYELTALSFI